MILEPAAARKCDRQSEEQVMAILRELGDTGHTINYSKTFNTYQYQTNVDSDVLQYNIRVTYKYRSAVQLELVGNNLKQMLDELIAWKATT
jgi:hypothetical protein